MNAPTLTALIAGVGMGSLVAVLGQALVIVYTTSGYFHFGLSAFLMLGAVMSYILTVDDGLPLYVNIAVVVAGGFVLGLVSEQICVRSVVKRVAHPQVAVLFSTFGLALIIESLAEKWFGAAERPVPSYVSAVPWQINGVLIRPIFVAMIIVALVFASGFEVVLRRTGLGLSLRATQLDKEGAALLGIRTSRVTLWMFGFAGALAGLVGLLMAPLTYASSSAGDSIFFLAFGAIAIGGFSSFIGAILGGVVIGVANSMVAFFWTPEAASAAVFGLILAVLIVRPQGLLGTAGRDV
jgi:branched-subunit amino acid ABC-type transport system permease component